MDKRKSILLQYALIAVLGITIALIIHHITTRSDLNITAVFSPDMTLTDNPLMGFAPDASNEALCKGTDLVFIPVTFAEWEPREGFYDTASLERRYNIERWKKENKHAVIRFMCDVPDAHDHMDIPKWLYDMTGTGTHYDTGLGKGYSPDYADATFIRYHERALKKLAEYCNSDHFVVFVELGSIGHWGEWHAAGTNGRSLMPEPSVCADYARLYSESFVNARLLTRRNYDFAVGGMMGCYNDMVGAKEDTEEWLGWLENGGTQETSGDDLVLTGVGSYGKKEPVGGEFTSSVPMETLMTSQMGEVLAMISSSNMTFIGPMVPDYLSGETSLAADSVLKRLGYRIYVSEIRSQYDFADDIMELSVTFKNAGRAGFFFDWPVTVYIFDANKKQVYWEGLDLDLRELSSDDGIEAVSRIPVTQEIRDEFYIGISITDYDGNDHIKLAIDSEDTKEMIGNAQIIYHYVDPDTER
ncbi:MAG: DUF4832 domain-containing protein [Lachnospiraceae bacterium]|nr:DUF4832 domain-containing protein [Lachnospiraceae bacterium]